MPELNRVGDSAASFGGLGLALGFFVGCASQAREKLTIETTIKIGAIAAFFAAGGAAVGALAEGIRGLH
ncbi:MAG TPA: hypothetical protein VIJ51_15790 [Solirubrobacteraceae bacterium]